MDGYQELAEWLLSSPAGPLGLPQTAQLLPGQLPAELPLNLPLPPGARLVGSVLRASGGRMANIDVALEGPLPEAALVDFYRHQISSQGWSQADQRIGRQSGGFMPSLAMLPAIFCRGREGPWVSVSVIPNERGGCDIRLHLEFTNPGPCAAPPASPRRPSAGSLLPRLLPPVGVAFRSVGGHGSEHSFSSEAVALAGLSAAELEAHFAGQFAVAGWTRESGGADGPLAWSIWRLAREGEWQGLLLVLETSNQPQHLLWARVAPASEFGRLDWMQAVPPIIPPQSP